jgi:FkbM family methyltransferase
MFSKIRQRVRDYLADRLRVPSIESSLKRLAACGFKPMGVYDVGAYRGDFAEEVLKIWPQTRVTCFEPQTSRAEDLEALRLKHPNQIDYQACLLGAEPRDAVTFHVGDTASSVLAHSAGDQYPTIELPMTTIDTFRAEGNRGPCNLLKLDVQGYELDVLRGAESTLRSDVEVILAELNFLDIYAKVPLMHETLAWLAERDFVAYDISSLIRRPLDDALWQADFVFTRCTSELRRKKTWN